MLPDAAKKLVMTHVWLKTETTKESRQVGVALAAALTGPAKARILVVK